MKKSAPNDTKNQKPTGAKRLQKTVTHAILRATILELARVGYARMSIESVAKRAGVGKAALYRRWPNKQALVIALLYDVGVTIISTPDNGSLENDIADYVDNAIRLLKRPLARRILPDLYAEMSYDSELSDALRETIQTQKRNNTRQIIDRAISRQELSHGIDYEMAFDMLAAPLYWRMLVTREKISSEYRDRLISMTLAGLKALNSA